MITDVRARSKAARCGLLLVALLQLFVQTTLPFTHNHVRDGAAVQLVDAAGDDGGSQAAHADSCICRTIGSAVVVPPPSQHSVQPHHEQLAAASTDTHPAAVRQLDSSRPRAPPRA